MKGHKLRVYTHGGDSYAMLCVLQQDDHEQCLRTFFLAKMFPYNKKTQCFLLHPWLLNKEIFIDFTIAFALKPYIGYRTNLVQEQNHTVGSLAME